MTTPRTDRSRQMLAMSLATTGVLAATSVHAAGPEPVIVEPAVVAPSTPVDWTGSYAGLTFGATFGRSDAELDDYFGALIENDVESLGLFPRDVDEEKVGAIGGVTLGYNVQRGNAVGGIEFDLSSLDHDVVAEFSRFDASPGFTTDTDTTYGTDISGLATLRLRAGFAQERNLFYGTAGVAAAQVENTFTLGLPEPDVLPPYSNSWSEDDTLYGYVVGIGFERKLSPRVSLKGEVLYYDLEDVTVEARDNPTFSDQGLDYEFQNDGYIARIGVNFAF